MTMIQISKKNQVFKRHDIEGALILSFNTEFVRSWPFVNLMALKYESGQVLLSGCDQT